MNWWKANLRRISFLLCSFSSGASSISSWEEGRGEDGRRRGQRREEEGGGGEGEEEGREREGERGRKRGREGERGRERAGEGGRGSVEEKL